MEIAIFSKREKLVDSEKKWLDEVLKADFTKMRLISCKETKKETTKNM